MLASVLIVAAVGGSALLGRVEPFRLGVQRNIEAAATALAELAREHHVVVTHGSGPPIGLLALPPDSCRDPRTYPLEVLGAQSDAMLGSLLEHAIADALPGREVVSLLTQTVVDALDPAFRRPAAPIGPVYGESEATRLATERGWTVAAVDEGWRRVVAAPAPRAIVELRAIQLLVDAGVVVVCESGGGIPVVVDVHGVRHVVEAVVDEDWAAASLARQLEADLLAILTDEPHGHALAPTTPDELRDHERAHGPLSARLSAASWFVSTTGRPAAIGPLADAAALVAGSTGTRITPEPATRS